MSAPSRKETTEPDIVDGKIVDKSIFNKSPYLYIKTMLAVVVALVGMILAIVAYVELESISNDVYDVLNNWKTKPVVDMALADWRDGCPSGYSVFSLDNSDFPGVKRGHCGCVPHHEYTSQLTNCSVEAEESTVCMSYVEKAGVDAQSWRGKLLCVKRGGEPAESWSDGYHQRPHPDGDGECPTGYHKCGEGYDHNDGSAICFPDDEEPSCPLTNAVVAKSIPSGDGWLMLGAFDDSYSLFGRREGLREFPMVDLQLKLTSELGDSFRDGVSYSTGSQDRGPCYLGTNQVLNSKLSVSSSAEWRYSASYPSSCKRVDTRYEMFESLTFEDHYLSNFQEHVSSCDGFELYPLGHDKYEASEDPDYVNSGIECGSDNRECERPSDQLTNCDPGDSTCLGVVFQSDCGHYAQAARSWNGASNAIGKFTRRQIFWDENCKVDENRIFNSQDPLTSALDALLAVVVISAIFTIVMIGLTIFECKSISGRHVVFLEVSYKEIFKLVTTFLMIGPLIAALITVKQVATLYETVGEDKCSDSLTNYTFKYLGEELPAIYAKTTAQIVLQCTLFGFSGAMMARKYKKIREAAKVYPGSTAPGDQKSESQVQPNGTPKSAEMQQQGWAPQQTQPMLQAQPVVPQQTQPIQSVMQQDQQMAPPQHPVVYQQQQPMAYQQQPPMMQNNQPMMYQQQPIMYQQQPVMYQHQSGMMMYQQQPMTQQSQQPPQHQSFNVHY